MVKEGSFFVIQSFMVNDLGLKGNELLAYAIIYGFSQDGKSWFSGSRRYIAEWCNMSISSVNNSLSSLVNKGLIEKRETFKQGVKFCFYRAVEKPVENSTLTQFKNCTGGTESLQGVVQKLNGGSTKSVHNNIEDNIKNNIDKIYSSFIEKFGKNANQYKLTPIRRKKIQARLKDAGEEMLLQAIERASKDSFYSGANDRGWSADLDYITRSYEVVEKLANLQPKQNANINDNEPEFKAIPL